MTGVLYGYNKAKDEVTCNAIEAIQKAENFADEIAQTMADLQYTKTEAEEKLTAMQKFFRKIKLALNNILDRIRNKRSGDLMITAEGMTISKDVAMVNDLLKKVRQGLTNVRTNYDAYVAGAEVKGAGDGKVRYSFVGYEDDGKGKYISSFPIGTPKKAKAQRILKYIQDVWSKKPIPLKINENGVERIIYAQFDPTYDENMEFQSDASKLMGGNRHGTSAEQRVTLDLADDYYKIASEAVYNYSKAEEGKTTIPHEQVKMWHYFVNDIYFAEYGSDKYAPYRVTINVKEKDNGTYVYSFSAEKAEKFDTQRTLHAAVRGENAPNVELSKNRIAQKDPIVKENSPTDSDGELKQHISSEAEEQAKADELMALREENKTLKAMDKRRWQMIDYLQKQLDQWKKGGKKLDYRGIEKLARSLINDYGAKVDVKAYAKELTGFFNYMTNNTKPSADVIRKRYTELAEKLIHNAEATDPEVQERLTNIKGIIKGGISLNANQHGDMLHRYESMSNYREKVGGTVKITNKGIPLDDAWQELSNMYPDLFPADTTDADQPIVMAEVISMLNENLKYNPIADEYLGNEEAALMEAVAKIVDGFHSIPELVDAASAYKAAYAEAKAYFEKDRDAIYSVDCFAEL